MRISIFLLFVCVHASAITFSQKVTLTGKNMTLTQAFNSIKQQTGYSFFWDQQLLDKAPLINISVKDASITEALEKCLKGLPLSYEIKGKIAFITTKEKSLTSLEMERALSAPIYEVTGMVRDEKGKPLAGATLKLIPLNMQAVSDASGKYKFANVPLGHYTMEVSFIGYGMVTKNFLLENKAAVIDVMMQPEQEEQEEVVVSTGYQKMKKASVTGSYTVITAKDIEQTPAVNIMERLEGKVPGVLFDVRNNRIQIRGVNNYTGLTPPLIVIDGFPSIDQKLTTIRDGNTTANPTNVLQPGTSGNAILSSFNPADIESITFLKDAAASAIWGASASNGVIVIETKKGKKGPASINLNTTVSTSSPADLSNLDVMSAADYINLEQELVDKKYILDPASYYRNAPVTEAEDWMFRVGRGTATTAQRDSALTALGKLSNQQQLKDYMLQKQVTQQYNLSLSGGGDNSSYYISGNYTRSRPVLKSNGSESYFVTANLNNDFLNKRITVATILNYTYAKNTVNSAAIQALSLGRLGLAPYEMIADANGNLIQRGRTFTDRVSDSITRLGYLSWKYNPVDELNYGNTVYTKNAVRANMSVTGVITNWLNVQVSGQLQRNIDDQALLQNLNSLSTRELVNTGTILVNGRPTYGVPYGGVYKTSNTNSEDYGLRGQFNVNKSWNGIHQFTMIAGSEIRQTKATGYTQTRYGYDEETSTSQVFNPTVKYATIYFPTIATAQLGYTDGNIYKGRTRYLSYYSNANYSLWNKYFVSGSVRFDDATQIGVDRRNRALPLWSAGLKWDITKERFLQKASWVNFLSARVTYGKSGSLPFGVTNVNTVNIGLFDSYTQLPYTTLGTPVNADLSWAITRTINAGLDAALFSNRLNLSLDVYDKRTYDLVVNLPFNSTYGISSLNFNTADLSGHGVELNLTGQIIRSRNWQWTSNFNFSYNTNKVTDDRYPDKNSVGTNIIIEGKPVDGLFVYRWGGLDNKGQSQILNSKGAKLPITTNTSLLAPEDKVYAGRLTAPYFGGFTNTIQYKNLSLSVRATYYMGHKFLKQDLNAFPSSGGFSGLIATSKALVNRWRNPGDEAFTNVPGFTSGMNFNNTSFYSNSDLNVRDAGNVRLQQITLGYQVPKIALSKVPVFKAAAINATVSNLGIIWRKNKDGIDPDYISTGTFNNLPPSVSYTLNLNLTF